MLTFAAWIDKSMKDLLVSVIMPAYNAAKYIGESIRSVMRQTYPDWELLVVDDCSTDDTYAIAQSFAVRIAAFVFCKRRSTAAQPFAET